MSDVKVEKKTLMEVINTTPPEKLPAIPAVADRFKELYQVIHSGISAEKSAAYYEAEKFHFMKQINDNKNLQGCTKKSLYGCFIDIAVSGLSCDPSFKQVYLVPFNINIGTKEKPVWEKRAQLQISGYGELLLRQMHGQIKYADNPVLVYESDIFKYGTRNGVSFVDHEAIIPRTSDKIIACYLKITRADGTLDYKVIVQEDIDRYRKFSKEPNSKAWTDGIGGMWQSKCIKHAFKNYPRVRTGAQHISLSTDSERPDVAAIGFSPRVPIEIDYSLDEGEMPGLESKPQEEKTEDVPHEPVDDDAFTKDVVPPAVTKRDDDDF